MIQRTKTNNSKIRIESDGELTRVYTPNGDLIPCVGIKFIHDGGEPPKAILEVLDFELDAKVSEDALEFVKKHLESKKEE
jgi:hypothetical protein